MNDRTNSHPTAPEQPTDEVRRLADEIHSNANPAGYRYAILRVAADQAVEVPAPHRLQHLADVLAALDLESAETRAELAATVAAIRAERGGAR
ncbi:hypothetical protein [Actinocatenispora comari]|uniref:Uncharacterized protein n=1 Tax=Actinocatenispora comari TaxID=2807577 RepID=A0A8J4EQL4_9ACTN|nr:hypothetical protein [Actinocatenispora comari]GIL29949.1 hypothetical protein NUM_52030 [Actinocatenispora comari]